MAIGKSEVKPTAAVVLDTRRQKTNGTYPIRLERVGELRKVDSRVTFVVAKLQGDDQTVY